MVTVLFLVFLFLLSTSNSQSIDPDLSSLTSKAPSAACLFSGYSNLSSYQYNLILTSPYNQLPSPFSYIFFPIYTTIPLSTPSPSITNAVIFVHGLGRNADTYFCNGMHASQNHPNTIVVAPWFNNMQLTSDQWESGAPSGGGSAYWDVNSWASGVDATPKPSKFTSSFDALDALVGALSNETVFPGIRLITLVGFSAGAQALSRYSWASSSISSSSSTKDIRFIMGDPGTYLYLSNVRPDKTCRPLMNNGGSAYDCRTYVAPSDDCPKYDSWKYGLSSIPSSSYLYLSTRYLNNPSAIAASTAALRTKDIRFILGKYDTCNCNQVDYVNDEWCFHSNLTCTPVAIGVSTHCCDTYPDSIIGNAMSTTCEADEQGYNRYQRGLLYMAYLRMFWRDQGYVPMFESVDGMGHDDIMMVNSDVFQKWAYVM